MAIRRGAWLDRPLALRLEGHELAILGGAAETLRTQRPVLLVECEARLGGAGSVAQVAVFLGDLGYEGRPLGEFDPARQPSPRSPGYVNNFLFRPR